MYWTLELATKLEDAPWPATKDELIDYAMRSGAPLEVIENLQEIEDEGETYESIEDIWPDYPTHDEDFFFDEEEYSSHSKQQLKKYKRCRNPTISTPLFPYPLTTTSPAIYITNYTICGKVIIQFEGVLLYNLWISYCTICGFLRFLLVGFVW